MSYFNEEQQAHMRYLASIPREQRCASGWHIKTEESCDCHLRHPVKEAPAPAERSPRHRRDKSAEAGREAGETNPNLVDGKPMPDHWLRQREAGDGE